MDQTELILKLIDGLTDTAAAQQQNIAQLNHDFTSLSVSFASLAADVSWLKWFFLAITVAVIAQTVKMIVDHFSKKEK